MEFAGQGTAILVLWREIAWKDDKPKKNFTLGVDKIIFSEQEIIKHMWSVIKSQ
jgi:hypothetical protein